MRFTQSIFLSMIAIVSVASFANPAQGGLMLPPTGSGLSQTFGDFEVFSLPFLDNKFGGFKVPSAPGQIKDTVVIATGTNNGPLNANFAYMDDAYRTPDGGTTSFFGTSTTADPGSVGNNHPLGDTANTWDADVGALSSFLTSNNGQLVFFFNLNETNSGADALNGQNVSVWAKATLVGVNPLDTKVFYFSAADDPLTVADEHAAGLAASILGAPEPNPALGYDINNPADQWATAHGAITVAANGDFLHFGRPQVGDPAGAMQINQNLGADEAAFAAFSADLDNAVRNDAAKYKTLQIDLRLSAMDNGYEQVFILPMTTIGTPPVVVPEPGSLLAFGCLMALGLKPAIIRRKRR